MVRECFGRFGEGNCFDCLFVELCSSYFVVEGNKGCPLFGKGFENANEMCKLCLKYFVGEECKRKTGGKRKVV